MNKNIDRTQADLFRYIRPSGVLPRFHTRLRADSTCPQGCWGGGGCTQVCTVVALPTLQCLCWLSELPGAWGEQGRPYSLPCPGRTCCWGMEVSWASLTPHLGQQQQDEHVSGRAQADSSWCLSNPLTLSYLQ